LFQHGPINVGVLTANAVAEIRSLKAYKTLTIAIALSSSKFGHGAT